MEKVYRLELIKELLVQRTIANHDELQAELLKKGVKVTQATLSRDLKTLRVSRVTNNLGKSSYVLQNPETPQFKSEELPDHLSGVTSVDFSGQFGVIKTIPGFASAVAYYIDQVKIPEIMGTIAGDDTILLISRAGVSANQLAGILTRSFPGLAEKFN